MATAAPIPVQTTTPQASSTPQPIAPALQAVAATVAPAQAPSQPLIVARPTKDGIDTTQTRATAEAVIRRETPQTAASLAGKAQLNKAAGEQGGAKDTATPVSAPSATPEAAPPTQITSTAATTTQATHVQNAAIDASAQRATPAAAQVAREIVRRFDGGATSFELRLDPPELGRVEVRMEVSRDHRVTAVIAADTPQALTELARHARDLEQQLQSAGLELSDQGLSFDLRQGATGGETEDAGNAAHARSGEEATAEPAQPTARPIGFERWRGVRVDMMV
jgi:flagellar hook-length control protein FliK